MRELDKKIVKTSYFSKYKLSNGVSIARGTPNWFSGKCEERLFPTWEMINDIKSKKISEEEYIDLYYNIILSKLNPSEIYEKHKDSVLLCWEKIGEFCHRRIVASWIKETIGIEVEEYGIWRV